jgi:hypothetical protein
MKTLNPNPNPNPNPNSGTMWHMAIQILKILVAFTTTLCGH